MTAATNIPRHIAIIMDGNGRWAERRGLARTAGHQAGAESVREVVRAARELGVGAITLYSFSTENWGRPADEVKALMSLLERYLVEETEELLARNIRLRAIGELDRLPASVRMLIRVAEGMTARNDGMVLSLALSYGGRAEITAACKSIARDVAAGRLRPDAIDESTIQARLYTAGIPDPDILIRTGGDLRVSNFLLWQIAYSELFVTPAPWPEFRRAQLLEVIEAYGSRQRRYGLVAGEEGPRAGVASETG
jgi:undecaprenyl diphosphate synthase